MIRKFKRKIALLFFKVGNTDKKGRAGYFWSGKLYTLIATNYTFLNSLRPPKKVAKWGINGNNFLSTKSKNVMKRAFCLPKCCLFQVKTSENTYIHLKHLIH